MRNDITIAPFNGIWPRIHDSAFIAPGCRIIGDVEIGAEASIWYNCVIRADINHIRIGARSNVQDGTIIHCDSPKPGRPEGFPTLIGEDVLIGHLAMIHGCTETIGQAITNLVENALVHTAPGSSVDITVEGGEHPEIRVRDHGPGVPEAERELVFQRFWRQDRRKGGGAGLGLSIVRRAMELHRGRVWVEAAAGGGAVFVLRF